MKVEYENWLTEILDSKEVLEQFGESIISPILRSAKRICLDKNLLSPSFFEISKKDFVQYLIDELQMNKSEQKISIGIMVKNQEKRIFGTIMRALELCDHMIVVDTGSTDETLERIKEIKSSKIEVHEILWTDNFSEMRNNIIRLNSNKWLFFVDSDEIIDSMEDINNFRDVLNLIDILARKNKICLQVKIWAAQYASFSVVDRIIRREDNTKYFGKVHEGVEGLNQEVLKVRFDFHLHNAGLLPSEREKFDKHSKYKKLTSDLLEKDPDNPRWIANMENPESKASKEELEKFLDILKRGLLIDGNKALSITNLKESSYLHMILGKYLFTRMALGEFDIATVESRIGLKKFPDSTVILFIHHFSKYLKFEQEKRRLFNDLLIDRNALDFKKSEEISHQRKDLLESLVVRYMFDFRDYNSAMKLISNITDFAALENLKIENQVLKKISRN